MNLTIAICTNDREVDLFNCLEALNKLKFIKAKIETEWSISDKEIKMVTSMEMEFLHLTLQNILDSFGREQSIYTEDKFMQLKSMKESFNVI